ncbi:hypothetical protein ATHL_00046 [Anaerolinea thermolimosa]|uniref:hypothetical protein n=1 Tax=Anaerolinea thermolimosa TaxID=229919 RepID=UPI000783D531|nr:hypothetical protein [Anaerolinea thermolimosa]GAP05217.1 hypothetical protein ATHL_00046 [Anaerolinea thermolimosa]
MRGKPLLILLVGLLLAGCMSAPAGADPAALRATAQAAEALAGQLEQQAEAARQEQAMRMEQTAQAVAMEATRQALRVEGTRQVLEVEAQTFRLTATAEAVAREAEREALVQNGGIALLGLTLLGLAGVMVGLAWKAGSAWITWQSRRRQLVESRAGTLLLVAENAPPVRVEVIQPALPTPLPAANHLELETETEPIPYAVNGTLVGFIPRQARNAEEGARRVALRLLRESIQAAGAHSNRIPGWRELGWSAESWTQAVRLLSRYVETQPGKGTYLVGEYESLQELYYAVGERRVTLSPAPLERA